MSTIDQLGIVIFSGESAEAFDLSSLRDLPGLTSSYFTLEGYEVRFMRAPRMTCFSVIDRRDGKQRYIEIVTTNTDRFESARPTVMRDFDGHIGLRMGLLDVMLSLDGMPLPQVSSLDEDDRMLMIPHRFPGASTDPQVQTISGYVREVDGPQLLSAGLATATYDPGSRRLMCAFFAHHEALDRRNDQLIRPKLCQNMVTILPQT